MLRAPYRILAADSRVVRPGVLRPAAPNPRATASGAARIAGDDIAGERVHFATFPLVGFEAFENAIVFAGAELPDVLAQHCAIIVERPAERMCMIFDFLPESPTSPATAAALLRGGDVRGVARHRQMRRVPRRRCRFLGQAAVKNAMRTGIDFNASYDTRLKLFDNDCRDHSRQLARLLLGDPTLEINV